MKKYAPLSFIILITLLFSCSKPYDKIKDKIWEGEILRRGDYKKLSEVILKLSNDSLFIYSNAIFGSENDTLKLISSEEKDSSLTFNSIAGNLFKVKLDHFQTDTAENLFLVGNDYAIVLARSHDSRIEDRINSFYWNVNVPRDAHMYLDGTYKGELEMENQFSDLLLGSMGGASVKMVFLEGFRVKIFFRSLLTDLFASSSNPNFEIVDYRIEGNRLILDNNKSKARNIEVKDFGETLVMETDELNVILHKTN